MTERTAHRMDTEPAGRRWLVLLGAALLLVVTAFGVVAMTRDDTEEVPAAAGEGASPGQATVGEQGAGSCVEVYDLDTLDNREVAFDGTVEEVDGDTVRFKVNQWYRGDSSEKVSLGGAAALTGVTSAGPGATLSPAARFLVAGDGGFAWACGFTQPYDPAVAEQWANVLAD